MENRLRAAHLALDTAVIQHTNPFVPFRKGVLSRSPATNSEVGTIRYATPYARRMYYGTAFRFRRAKHPQATHHWLEAARARWMPVWIRAVRRLLLGRGGD